MKKKLTRGLVQIYTGDGRGKTTAALGQALRAAGRGYKVKMIQFLKATDTGELHAVKKLEPNFMIYRFETQKKFFWTLDEEEKEKLRGEVQKALAFARKILEEEDCNILILDEILGALGNKLVSMKEIKELINIKPDCMELIFTGRNAPEELLREAHLVTEMKMIKHPADKGIEARKGIEF